MGPRRGCTSSPPPWWSRNAWCCAGSGGWAPHPAPAPRPGLPPAVLRRAKEFLHDKMNRNPGITELSAAVGMSVDHFSRMFKRSTGLAPHQYLGDIRLERAKRLLAEGRTPIIEIAYEIGYANPSQFSAFFRKRTGFSPSAFRRNTLTASLSG
jgi:AraC family transcriptional regulator